jgi:hypothetical protein
MADLKSNIHGGFNLTGTKAVLPEVWVVVVHKMHG